MSTLLPEPISLIIPEVIALHAISIAYSFDKSGLYSVSRTYLAAKEPEPSVAYGTLSYEPCGYIATKCFPSLSIPTRINAAEIAPLYLKRWLIISCAAAPTFGCLPVFKLRRCN